jgi:hypothetical protein
VIDGSKDAGLTLHVISCSVTWEGNYKGEYSMIRKEADNESARETEEKCDETLLE